MRSRTFRVGILCGIAGVLVDADHIIAHFVPYLQQWYPNEPLRCFHPQLFIISSVAILGLVAYFTGLYLKMVLRRNGERRCDGDSTDAE